MGNDWQKRSIALIGDDKMNRLKSAKVAVFGIGGVGGYVAETLCRAGIGHLLFVDRDSFEDSNLNRQLFSLNSNLGYKKVDVAKKRLLDINPNLDIEVFDEFYNTDTVSEIKLNSCDYCVDAIDTMKPKILLIKECKRLNVPIISCMGTGFRIDVTKLKVADIYDTDICPMARSMRKMMRGEGIKACKVVYSTEKPMKPAGSDYYNLTDSNKRALVGSMCFVPAAAGILLANTVVREILRED